MNPANPLQVALNGEPRSIEPGLTIEQLVRQLGRDPRTVAVEYNGDILARQRYAGTVLADGDRIEIVHFVQGG